MVCDLYPSKMGKKGEPTFAGEGCGELLPLEQSETEMERSRENYRRAPVQILRFCKGER